MNQLQGCLTRPYSSNFHRSGARLCRTLLLACAVLLTGGTVAQAQNPKAAGHTKSDKQPPVQAVVTQPQSGTAILLKTIQSYQSLNSYVGQANVDTLMLNTTGQTVKHIGSSSVMKLQRPNKLSLFFQTPIGSRRIYSDGKDFTVYDATPNQYMSVPTAGNVTGLLKLLLTNADVAAGLDPLFFLSQTALPRELTGIKLKGPGTYNGHPVYIVTGVTNATPVVVKNAKGTMTIPTSYWTWWIDRSSYLLYKVETMTPNIVKPVSFGSGASRTVQNIKGTLVLRHTITELKPDADIPAEEFVFKPLPNTTRRQTTQEVLNKKGK